MQPTVIKKVGGYTESSQVSKSKLENQIFTVPNPEAYPLAGYCLKTRLTLLIFLCMREHVVFDFIYTQLSKELEYWR